jgi:hypothetical protein
VNEKKAETFPLISGNRQEEEAGMPNKEFSPEQDFTKSNIEKVPADKLVVYKIKILLATTSIPVAPRG